MQKAASRGRDSGHKTPGINVPKHYESILQVMTNFDVTDISDPSNDQHEQVASPKLRPGGSMYQDGLTWLSLQT